MNTPKNIPLSDYAFGSEMRARTSGAQYRFGFNGKEKVDEISGGIQGADYDYDARMYDARLGRWMSADPDADKYPNISPYVFANNSPICLKDPDGKVVVDANGNVVNITFNTNGTLSFSGGQLSPETQTNLQVMSSTDIGKQLIQSAISSNKLINPTVTMKLALVDAAYAKTIPSYKKQFDIAIKEGTLKESDLVQGNYFLLEGYTYETEDESGTKEITKSEVYLGSTLYTQDPGFAVELGKAGALQILDKDEGGTRDATQEEMENLDQSKILPSPYKGATTPASNLSLESAKTGTHELTHALGANGEAKPRENEKKFQQQSEPSSGGTQTQ